MMEQTAGRGLTERLLARAVRPPRGSWVPTYTVYLIASLAWSVVAVYCELDDRRLVAFAGIVLGAINGGALAVVSAEQELSSWRRALAAIVNICAEGAMIAAAAVWSRGHEDRPAPLAVGFLAFGGAILLSYARTRIRASSGMDLADGPWGIASREVRLLVLALGLLGGQAYWALVAIATLANGAVLGHLGRLRMTLRG
jgi:hypothetical protein